MHPDLLHLIARQQAAIAQRDAERRWQLVRRARPPSRVRYLVALALAHAASRVTDEPVVVLPRRA